MGQVTIEVNSKPYVVGCEDGQEQRLRQIAAVVDQQVRQVTGEIGTVGETRLLLMGALLMADELTETKARLSDNSAELSALREALADMEARAVGAIAGAADRVERLAIDWEAGAASVA